MGAIDERGFLYLLFLLFLTKREVTTLEVETFGKSLLSGFAHANNVKFYRYFWRVTTFRGSLLSEPYGMSCGV